MKWKEIFWKIIVNFHMIIDVQKIYLRNVLCVKLSLLDIAFLHSCKAKKNKIKQPHVEKRIEGLVLNWTIIYW